MGAVCPADQEERACQIAKQLLRYGLHHKSALSSVSLPLSPLLIGAQQLTQDVQQYRLRIACFASYITDLPTDPMAYAQALGPWFPAVLLSLTLRKLTCLSAVCSSISLIVVHLRQSLARSDCWIFMSVRRCLNRYHLSSRRCRWNH